MMKMFGTEKESNPTINYGSGISEQNSIIKTESESSMKTLSQKKGVSFAKKTKKGDFQLSQSKINETAQGFVKNDM